jgi:adenylate cyclase
MGDEIMVIWGAPVDHHDDPVRAVRAALEIKTELKRFNQHRIRENRPEIKIGIGVNTGALVAGYIGSSQTMSYSVIGDTVNTASRLCAAATESQILITENTQNCLGHLFETVEFEPVRAKGKFEPIRVFGVIRENGPSSPPTDEQRKG